VQGRAVVAGIGTAAAALRALVDHAEFRRRG
jgi:hypothetical protein